MPWRFLRSAAKFEIRRKLEMEVEGLANVPTSGPVMIVARHYHHLFDGCVLIATLPRPAHILVALDWVENTTGRSVMDRACRAAGWPVVMRSDGKNGVNQGEAAIAFRQAAKESLSLFEDGRILIVFPEGFPNVDPGYTPKVGAQEFLPFRDGYLNLARMAERRGIPVPIIPTGFSYQHGPKWQVRMHFGAALRLDGQDLHALGQEVEIQVRTLSGVDLGVGNESSGTVR